MTPACMTSDELTLWQRSPYLPAKIPCIDCPLSFAAEMKAAGCCNGRPSMMGRPRLSDSTVERHGRGNPYTTEAERIAARRQTWRAYKRRANSE